MTASSIPSTIRVSVVDVKPVEKKNNVSIIKWCCGHWKKIVSEFMATFILVVISCMSTIPVEGFTPSPTDGAFCVGFVVMINTQIFGHVSGALMNPCVTLASVIWGRISVVLGIVYFLTQCLAAYTGYGVLMTMSAINTSHGLCVPSPHPSITDYQAVGVEIMLTSVLIFFNCGIWHPANDKMQDSSAVKFALTITGLALAGNALTGASTNPARALGAALWTGRWDSHWVYWVGPLTGGGSAAIIYKYTWLKENY